MMKKMLSLLLSAVMLLAPMASVAEEAAGGYMAGELTTMALSDSYYAGNQINVDAALGLALEEHVTDETAMALARLLSKATLHMSFYDDFGTARIHAELSIGDVNLLRADMLRYEDGSTQLMSNLTGNMVLAMPAQDSEAVVAPTMADYNFGNPDDVAAFRALPAAQRLQMTSGDMVSLLINHLLGWVSYMQMDNDGELYQFDDTYLEATQTRDPVAQRMIGKIKADSFNTLLWNVATTVADTTGEFQQALADLLAENGVTRYDARMFIDSLLTEETIDPALDFVQPSYYIIENKDSSPIQYDDVSYFFKKLQKSTQRIWDNGTDNVMTMDVSYDDFGEMVGFDAHAPQFTTLLPYEGDFTYSIKTDDFWQRFHTSHGELQIYDDNRIIGDLDIQFGEDVDGVNHSHFIGQADVVDQKDGASVGFGVDAKLEYAIEDVEAGQKESFEGHALLNGRADGEDLTILGLTVSGETTAAGDALALNATGALSLADLGSVIADVQAVQAEYEEIAFAGGQAVDVTAMDEAQKTALKGEITKQAASIALSLIAKPDVLADVMTIFGGMAAAE